MAPKRREKWYSLDGQRQIHQAALQSNTGPRRLISLVVLLILVMMMIQQTSDTRKVAKVAGAIGLLPPNNSNSAQSSDSTLSPLHQIDDADGAMTPPIGNQTIESLGLVSPEAKVEQWAQIVTLLMQDLSGDAKAGLTETIFGIADQPKKSTQAEPLPQAADTLLSNWLESSKKTLSRWIDLSDSQTPEHAWLEELQIAWESWSQSETPAAFLSAPTITDEFQRSLRLGLDRSLLADLTDNTPWKTIERLSLARLLLRATELAGLFQESITIDAVPSIAIPQLLSQTDALRGRCYRIRGSIGLIEPISRIELANDRTLSYAVIWIRPEDLSDQPINVCIPQGVATDLDLKTGDNLEVAGLIAKRRAYASERGGEIAPVMIATCLIKDPPAEESDTPAQSNPNRMVTSLAIAKQLAATLNRPTWKPPVDRQAPLDLIQQSLSKHLAKISVEDLPATEPKLLAKSPPALATLANLVKFKNEVHTVVSGGNSTMLSIPPTDHPNPLTTPLLGSWQGFIIGSDPIPVPPETLPGLDWKTIYLLNVQPDPNGNKPNIQVLAHDIPVLWQSTGQIHQPVSIEGLGLMHSPGLESTGKSHLSDPPWMILASKLVWQFPISSSDSLPSTDGLVPPLSLGQQQLLALGWDLSQSDPLERMHGQSLTSKDAHPFYSLLAIQKKRSNAKSSEALLDGPESKNLTVMEWIRRTEAIKQAKRDDGSANRSVGERVSAKVHIRRIQRVEIQNASHQEWLNGNHYYQLDGVADIGQNRIEIKYGKDFEPISYEREFPITLVAATLPAWILSDPTTQSTSTNTSRETTDLDSSSTIAWSTRIRVDVQGFAYRIWRFQTPQVSAVTQDKGYQQAPMMVVDRWQISRGPIASEPPSKRTDVPMASVLTTIFGLAAIGWFAYRMMGQSRKRGS